MKHDLLSKAELNSAFKNLHIFISKKTTKQNVPSVKEIKLSLTA